MGIPWESLQTITSWILLGAGGLFLIIGALGVLRMPDLYSRMHAAGLTDTMGAGLILTGMIVDQGLDLVSFKLFLIMVLGLYLSPVATHALARAAHHGRVTPLIMDPASREDDGDGQGD